jgi:hypothetical protein
MPDLEKLGRRIAKLPSDPPPKSIRERVESNSGALGIGAIATALIAAIPGIVASFRQPTDPQVKADVEILKAKALAAEMAEPGKQAVDRAKRQELQDQIDRLSARIRDLDQRFPSVKPDPDRAPR